MPSAATRRRRRCPKASAARRLEGPAETTTSSRARNTTSCRSARGHAHRAPVLHQNARGQHAGLDAHIAARMTGRRYSPRVEDYACALDVELHRPGALDRRAVVQSRCAAGGGDAGLRRRPPRPAPAPAARAHGSRRCRRAPGRARRPNARCGGTPARHRHRTSRSPRPAPSDRSRAGNRAGTPARSRCRTRPAPCRAASGCGGPSGSARARSRSANRICRCRTASRNRPAARSRNRDRAARPPAAARGGRRPDRPRRAGCSPRCRRRRMTISASFMVPAAPRCAPPRP